MTDAVIIGAGPAGICAASEMCSHGARVAVLEQLSQVGGLSRTFERDGCRYDIGGHRFFTNNVEVRKLFETVVAEDLLSVDRFSRILYNQKLFDYPLSPKNALLGLGVLTSVGVMGSYAWARALRRLAPRVPRTFEEWVTDHFGSRLYRIFFKTYTEKVWGIPCSRIGADWASQRIKGLNLGAAIKRALFPGSVREVMTLADEFLYPRLGAGQFYERLADGVREAGSDVLCERKVTRVRREGTKVTAVEATGPDGQVTEFDARWLLSSAPLTELVRTVDPPPPDAVLDAARSLRYRGHVSVNLRLDGEPFGDSWIYVHSTSVRMGRISNYRGFSADMAGGQDVTPVTVEYFSTPGDDVWDVPDDELIERAAQELEMSNLAARDSVVSGFVVRNEQAYPVMEIGHQRHVETIREWLSRFENLTPIGRAGMFKYNNQDHSILTGLLAARTALGTGRHDPWLVNTDAQYHESGEAAAYESEDAQS